MASKQRDMGFSQNGNQFYDSLLTGQEQAENKTQSRFRLLPFEPDAGKSGTTSVSLTDEEGKRTELKLQNKI